eukprot:TRINITY_DN10935_c0_g1_i1.p1 TRINITY_DN10935_c0_g1~~TRINITY_DN10935_c0_g1_i1.p1  ORF type:complete len:657 (+),score=240.86 TRINITY_DN10935_c0_g1_i1:99-1973(+)
MGCFRGAGAGAAVLLAVVPAAGWYLPGTAPKEYVHGQNIPLLVNVMSSVNTHLPFDYYSLPHCKPKKRTKGETENLGEILMGDRIKPSPYEDVNMTVNFRCMVVCDPVRITAAHAQRFDEFIGEDYVMTMLLDNLPVSMINQDTNSFSIGFPLGVREGNRYYINNHLHFLIKYQALAPGLDGTVAKRVVAFTVRPQSVKHTLDGERVTGCDDSFDPSKLPSQPTTAGQMLAYSYGVTWEQSDSKWATRWDVYLDIQDHEIHWFSIVNSVMIAFFLSGILAAIMLRTLLRDIARYNAIEDAEDLQEETGWKLVHTDVFRPPQYKAMLACHVGTGVQLLGMCITVLVFACLGFLSPANRGALFTAILLCFVFLGIYGGYTSARLTKMWGEPSWVTTFKTATVVPGAVFTAFFILNLFVWSQGSTAAVPFSAIMAVMAIWFCISLPQVFLGAVLGYKKKAIEPPVRINQIARFVPEQRWYLQPWFTVMCGGVLPFGAVFIELFFILTSIWLNRYYYVFGFLLLVFIILCVTCAEITIVMCYFQLCAEDYHWWWRSFFTSGSSGFYVFLYSIFYFFTSSLKIKKFVSVLLFFGYMGIISYVFFVLTGTIGFIACFWFMRKIYSSIKID